MITDVIRDALTAEVQGLVTLKRKVFPLQSYLHDDYLERAILTQPPGQAIVPSTLTANGSPNEEQTSGYAVAALPTNEAPIAIQFIGSGASATYILAPGQYLRPTRKPFSAFRWGLPFGWLGGGVATIAIIKDPEAIVDWGRERPEILFHRFRTDIKSAATAPADVAGVYNLPTGFPWPRARSSAASLDYANAVAQPGKPMLVVEPTRTLIRVRTSSTDSVPLRVVALRTQFDVSSSGGATAAEGTFIDIECSGRTGSVDSSFFATYALPAEFSKLGGDDAALAFLDLADGDANVGTLVDVLRFGKLA